MKLGKREYLDVSVCWARDASAFGALLSTKNMKVKYLVGYNDREIFFKKKQKNEKVRK
jgi:hypothetical protein